MQNSNLNQTEIPQGKDTFTHFRSKVIRSFHDKITHEYTAISIYVVGPKLQAYATSTKQLQPHPLETPIFLSSKWLAIGDIRCMEEALLILLIVLH